MKLELKNFANIANAEISFNGLTVLTGKTNTGKEYITKALFGIIHGLYGIDDQVKEDLEKKKKYIKKIQELMDNATETDNVLLSIELNDVYRTERFHLEYVNRDWLGQETIDRYFCSLFSRQINSLNNNSEEVKITFKDDSYRQTCMKFADDRCVKFNHKSVINNDAFLLSNLNVLNLTNVDLDRETNISFSERHLIESLQTDDEFHLKNIVIDSMKKDVLKEINSIFHEVIDGKVAISPALYKATGWGILPVRGRIDVCLEKEDRPDSSIKCQNIEPGIKLFIILKRLIEAEKLKSKSTLIIEMPEAYLDAELQVKLAELLVLFQKKLGIYIVITTHSHYLIDALDIFSVKYGIGDQTDFYLMGKKNEKITIENVNDNMEKLYQESADVVQHLENLRYELNNN